MKTRESTWVMTYTGKRFYPFNPNPEDICIEDIAYSLSNMCRFLGHCSPRYSVAQHSVEVAVRVHREDPSQALAGLLHDAAEAYFGDYAGPGKKWLPDVLALEDGITAAMEEKFGVVIRGNELVTSVDHRMTVTEFGLLMPEYDGDIGLADEPFPVENLSYLYSYEAEFNFKTVYYNITHGLGILTNVEE